MFHLLSSGQLDGGASVRRRLTLDRGASTSSWAARSAASSRRQQFVRAVAVVVGVDGDPQRDELVDAVEDEVGSVSSVPGGRLEGVPAALGAGGKGRSF